MIGKYLILDIKKISLEKADCVICATVSFPKRGGREVSFKTLEPAKPIAV